MRVAVGLFFRPALFASIQNGLANGYSVQLAADSSGVAGAISCYRRQSGFLQNLVDRITVPNASENHSAKPTAMSS